MEKHNIVPNTPQDIEVMKSYYKDITMLTEDGWIAEKNATVKGVLFSHHCEIPTNLDEKELLQKLQVESEYPGEVTLEWLKKELGQQFTIRGKTDLVTALRKYRQQELLVGFWYQFRMQHPDDSTLSVKLDRLLLSIQEEALDMDTLLLFDELRLDYGGKGRYAKTEGGRPPVRVYLDTNKRYLDTNLNTVQNKEDGRKDGSYGPRVKGSTLRWKPKTSKNVHTIAIVDPDSWQNFELSEESQSDTESNTMVCILSTKYRNCLHINDFVTNLLVSSEPDFKTNVPEFMRKIRSNLSPLAPKGETPIWISTENFKEDNKAFLPYLKEATEKYKEVIWTCPFSTDMSR